MKDLRLTIVQMNSRAGDTGRNLDRMRMFVEESDGDIVCFPEMCLSGYSSRDPSRFALDPCCDAVSAVHSMAESAGKAVVFGYIEKDGKDLHLRQEIASEKGGFYRKTHLGLKEAELFVPGDDLPVFDIKGIKVGIQLCTESHIPDICATYRSKGAELVLTPFANGIAGERRRQVWHSYLPARACDNGMFVAGCSAVGDNGEGAVFGGGLIALDPKGMVLDEYYGDEERSITVDIGGKLPRDGPETMANISYFDRKRPELYRRN